jgi:hypothetical protein
MDGRRSPADRQSQRNVLAILAQLERGVIVSRVNAGIAEARPYEPNQKPS